MTRRSVGGSLDHHALALLHRPADPTVLAREARDLAGCDLTHRDIAQPLNPATGAALVPQRPAVGAKP